MLVVSAIVNLDKPCAHVGYGLCVGVVVPVGPGPGPAYL